MPDALGNHVKNSEIQYYSFPPRPSDHSHQDSYLQQTMVFDEANNLWVPIPAGHSIPPYSDQFRMESDSDHDDGYGGGQDDQGNDVEDDEDGEGQDGQGDDIEDDSQDGGCAERERDSSSSGSDFAEHMASVER